MTKLNPVLGVRVPAKLQRRLRVYAAKMGVRPGSVVRAALERLLDGRATSPPSPPDATP